MRLGQTSFVLTASKFVSSILGFFATVYFARELGAAVLGQYALVMALVTWIGIAGEVGLSKALIKRLSEGEQRQEFVGAAVAILGGLSLVSAVAVFLFASRVNAYVGASVAGFVVLLVFLNLFTTLTNAALQGHHLVHVYGVLTVGERTLRTIAQVLLVVVSFGLAGMLLGYAIAGLVAGVVALGYLRLRPAIPGRRHVESLFEFAKYAWLGNVSNRAFNSLDIAVLGLFVSPGLIGIYSVAWSISMFLNIFGGSLEGTLFPEMSQISSDHGKEAVADLTEEALRYGGLFTIPGLVGGVVVGDRLLRIYGDNFAQGATVLAILIGAALVYSYVRQLRNTLNAIDHPHLAFRVNGAFTVANVVLNVGLVYAYGWLGAAVGTLLAAVVGAATSFYYVRRHVGVSIPLAGISRQWAAAIVMGVSVYGLRQMAEASVLAQSNAAMVVGLVGTGAAIYIGLLGGISREFRTTVLNNLPFDARAF